MRRRTRCAQASGPTGQYPDWAIPGWAGEDSARFLAVGGVEWWSSSVTPRASGNPTVTTLCWRSDGGGPAKTSQPKAWVSQLANQARDASGDGCGWKCSQSNRTGHTRLRRADREAQVLQRPERVSADCGLAARRLMWRIEQVQTPGHRRATHQGLHRSPTVPPQRRAGRRRTSVDARRRTSKLVMRSRFGLNSRANASPAARPAHCIYQGGAPEVYGHSGR
jgi:hypothetical protein